MRYEDALREWGARRIESYRALKTGAIDRKTVEVQMEFNEGYACCGGSNPDCYCSYAESPSANVVIVGCEPLGHPFIGQAHHRIEIDAECFDFAQILGEIVAVGGGAIGA